MILAFGNIHKRRHTFMGLIARYDSLHHVIGEHYLFTSTQKCNFLGSPFNVRGENMLEKAKNDILAMLIGLYSHSDSIA